MSDACLAKLAPKRTRSRFWNVANRQVTKSFSKQDQTKSCISPDLSTIATKLKSGRVVLTDTSTRRERAVQPSSEFIEKTGGKFSIGWTPENQLEIGSSTLAVVFSRDESGSDNQLIPLVEQGSQKLPQPNRFEFTDLALTKNNELELFGWRYPLVDASNEGTTKGLRAFGLSINFANNWIRRNASYFDLKWPENYLGLTYLSNPSFVSPRKMVSPNGRFVLTWGNSTLRVSSRYSKTESRNLRVIDLEKPDRVLPIMNLAWISETVWSDDGSLLIVRGREWYERGSRDISKIIDLEQWSERVVEGLPLESVAHFHEWNDGFVCSVVKILKGNPRVSEWKVGYFAIKEGSRFQLVKGEFNSIHFLKFRGPNVVFRGWPFNAPEQKTSSSRPSLFFELSPDLELTEVPSLPFATKIPWKEYRSFDGKYRIEQVVVKGQADPRSTWPDFSIVRVGGPGTQDPISEVPIWTGPVRDFRWHPNANSAIWKDNQGSWLLFDPEQNQEPQRLSGIKVATPIENGWLILMPQTVRQVSLDGRTIAELSFDEDDSGGPVNPVWLFADGSVIGDLEPMDVIYEMNQEIRVDPLVDFLQKFPSATPLPPSKPPRLRLQPPEGR